jgi:hypothetical protein
VGDTSPYARAYALLFPEEDMADRARKAISLLTQDRELEALSPRELALICRAYNELLQGDKQLQTARLLWTRAPGSPDATRWMINSLQHIYVFADDNRPLLEFVDKALQDRQGNPRELLVFKAEAIIRQKRGLTDAQKRNLASDLLVRAYRFEPLPNRDWPANVRTEDSPNFIDFDQPFCSFFSAAERDSLKLRMQNAKDSRK